MLKVRSNEESSKSDIFKIRRLFLIDECTKWLVDHSAILKIELDNKEHSFNFWKGDDFWIDNNPISFKTIMKNKDEILVLELYIEEYEDNLISNFPEILKFTKDSKLTVQFSDSCNDVMWNCFPKKLSKLTLRNYHRKNFNGYNTFCNSLEIHCTELSDIKGLYDFYLNNPILGLFNEIFIMGFNKQFKKFSTLKQFFSLLIDNAKNFHIYWEIPVPREIINFFYLNRELISESPSPTYNNKICFYKKAR